VLDASGFPKSSEIFPGNAREPETLEKMLTALQHDTPSPTVVLDAGIATEENVAWLSAHGYRYVVVSRKRRRRFDPAQATLIKEADGVRIQAQRIVNADTGEVELYCHSAQRQKKEEGMHRLVGERLEAELQKLAEGLHKKRTTKRYEKVLERIGRLRQKYARAAQYYVIDVAHDPDSGLATAIAWTRTTPVDDTLPGVYCLRSNCLDWDEATLWSTYIMLTDLEAVFRSLKSELGLRPVFHHNKDRVRGHLFISVLAYHIVHTMRFALKASAIHLSWASLRRRLSTQQRVTVELKRADGRTIHVRRATRPEPRQQVIYDALGIDARPGRTETTLI
jgi:transposase